MSQRRTLACPRGPKLPASFSHLPLQEGACVELTADLSRPRLLVASRWRTRDWWTCRRLCRAFEFSTTSSTRQKRLTSSRCAPLWLHRLTVPADEGVPSLPRLRVPFRVRPSRRSMLQEAGHQRPAQAQETARQQQCARLGATRQGRPPRRRRARRAGAGRSSMGGGASACRLSLASASRPCVSTACERMASRRACQLLTLSLTRRSMYWGAFRHSASVVRTQPADLSGSQAVPSSPPAP